MGGTASKHLNCTARRKGTKENVVSPDRPYEPSISRNNHHHVHSTPVEESHRPGSTAEERELAAQVRPRSQSLISQQKYQIFSPTRSSSTTAFDFSPGVQNGRVPQGTSSTQAMASYVAQPHFRRTSQMSFVPSIVDEIPYMDASRHNSTFNVPHFGFKPPLTPRRKMSPCHTSQYSLAYSSAGHISHNYTFNFDNCDGAHIGDRTEHNISVERRAEQWESLQGNSDFKERQWKKATDIFQRTHSSEAALKMLEDENVVVVVGRKGDGKTSIAKTIILELEWKLSVSESDPDTEIILVEIENPQELLHLCSRSYDAHVLVLVDDVLGKSAVDGIKLDKWQRKAEDVWEALQDCDRIRLVMTLRKHVWNKAGPLLKDYDLFMRIVDLTDPDMVLKNEEKADILRAHLEQSQRDACEDLVEEVSERIPTAPGFPQCCHMFSTIDKLYEQGSQFFKKPSSFCEKLLEEMHTANPNLYMALALTLIFGGRFQTKNFRKEYLESRPRVRWSIEEVLESCSTDGKVTLGQLRKSFETLLDVFFEKDESDTYYRFNHDSIEEAVARHFGAKYPEVMISCCRLMSLQQWVCTGPGDQDSNVVFLKHNHFRDLCHRVDKELKRGKAATVFTLMPMKDEAFVTFWLRSLEKSAVIQDLLPEHGPQLLIQASRNGVLMFVEFLLSSRTGFVPKQTDLGEAVKAASCGGHADVLTILLDLEPPQAAVLEAFELLLEVGHVNCVQCLLEHSPGLLHERFPSSSCPHMARCMTSLHLAAYHGCGPLVTYLLAQGVDPSSGDCDGKTALHHAAESGYAHVVEDLLDTSYAADMLDAKDMSERTALFYATKEEHTDVVERLMEKGAQT